MRTSNCLFVALAAWLKHPLSTRLHLLWCPEHAWCPHVWWTRRGRSMHFCMTADPATAPWWRLLWHEGKIRRFPAHRVVNGRFVAPEHDHNEAPTGTP